MRKIVSAFGGRFRYEMMNALQRLAEFGQSFWLDDLSRAGIRGGQLAARVRDDGLRGITSNPTIFNKSIGAEPGTGEYVDQIDEGARAGLTARQIYEVLTTSDIREACDVFRTVYDATDGADGFVSLEVSPHLARDTQGSVAEGLNLWRSVERPNLMIKIPGTAEGVPAIEELLVEGVNVNVTLLFGLDGYVAVVEAWLRALERRLEAGRPVREIASVASLFLSRIDTLVDQLLAHRIRSDGSSAFAPHPAELRGKAAVAGAKVAYATWRRLVSGERWEPLAAAGARPQRLLWASTGTKNPAYSDVMYVEPLIGPDTVSTLPGKTAAAFADHGKVARTLARGVPDARRILRSLKALGIDLKRVSWQLENDGIQKFIEPYDESIAAIDKRRRETLNG